MVEDLVRKSACSLSSKCSKCLLMRSRMLLTSIFTTIGSERVPFGFDTLEKVVLLSNLTDYRLPPLTEKHESFQEFSNKRK